MSASYSIVAKWANDVLISARFEYVNSNQRKNHIEYAHNRLDTAISSALAADVTAMLYNRCCKNTKIIILHSSLTKQPEE
jgi:hypothetical protein